jgi:hypothetical protein
LAAADGLFALVLNVVPSLLFFRKLPARILLGTSLLAVARLGE